MKVHNHKSRTDTVPCVYFFIHKISKFIKQKNIKSIVDVGSGYGRVVNFVSTFNRIKSHGIEFDKEVHRSALILKNKRVNLYCGDIFNFDLKKFNSICFILIDPFKINKDRDKFLHKYEKIFPKKIKYLITVNICGKEFPNKYNLIYSISGSKTRCLKIYKINPIHQ